MSDRAMNAKSIHTLFCPFNFSDGSAEIQKFINEFAGYGWELKNMDYLRDQDFLHKRENFMRYQYFTGAARDIFCEGKKGSCIVYEYGNAADYSYFIQIADKEYELPIDEIELHLYDCGLGILLIRFINEKYTELSDIKKINDYARRISIPFLPQSENGFILCADRLGILKVGKPEEDSLERMVCVTDFRQRIKNHTKLHEQADFINEIIFHNLEKQGLCDNSYPLEFYTDDRLFVMCMLRDDFVSGRIASGIEPADSETEDLLYQLIFVDPTDSTCQDGKMKKELLDKALYRRWADYGTIHSATAYSFMCFTGETNEINESVVRPFVVEYTYIVSLALAQKYGISKFSEQAGKSVLGIEKKGQIGRKVTKRLTNLQEEYVAFKNKLMILNVSPQDQGIELYRLLQKQFMIPEEQEILDEQLESLYEIVNTSNGTIINKWGLFFAILAIVIELGLADWVVYWLKFVF